MHNTLLAGVLRRHDAGTTATGGGRVLTAHLDAPEVTQTTVEAEGTKKDYIRYETNTQKNDKSNDKN